MTATWPEVRRVGVFGGSFNPPHRGHEELVEAVLSRDLVDEVKVIPVFDHPFGKELAPFEDRLAMCRLAFARLPEVEVSTLERDLGGRSYTVRTLERLRQTVARSSELLLLVGADALKETAQWRDFDRVTAIARLLVVPRQGEHLEGAANLPAPIGVSSSEIRSRIARGQTTAGLLHPDVEVYIESRHLYQAKDSNHSNRGDST